MFKVFIFAILGLIFLANCNSSTSDEEMKLNDTFWHSGEDDPLRFDLYFTDKFILSSNGQVAWRNQYLWQGDSICIEYIPQRKRNEFFKTVNFNPDSIGLRSPIDTNFISYYYRSNEQAFFNSLQGLEKDELERFFKDTKYADRIDKIKK